MVNGHVKKNVTNIINKRDKKVVDALIKNGVNDIPDFKVNHRGDGYHGFFDVGGHKVTINTVLAGGHNVQCLHQRTTVKVK